MTLICRVVFHGDLPPLAWIEIRENDVAGDTPDAVEQNTIAAATKDLAFLKARLAEAYSGKGSGA